MPMDVFKRVLKNYKDNFDRLEDKRFHFASRLFFWTGDEFAKNKLMELKPEYIGTDEKEYCEKIGKILEEEIGNENLLFKKEREKFLIKYPLLKKYNKILFKNLFCETVYGIDLRNVINEHVKKEEFIELREKLWNDKAAIMTLSTHAINYFYALDYYLNEDKTYFNPESFIDMAEKGDVFENKDMAVLRVYLLTHCIIGESAFYFRDVKRSEGAYVRMFSELEKIINNDYENISLDNKVEFLVCAKLCKKTSYLESKILSDTMKAFDPRLDYFIENGKIAGKSAFKKGEHRNVLALMAFYLEKK